MLCMIIFILCVITLLPTTYTAIHDVRPVHTRYHHLLWLNPYGTANDVSSNVLSNNNVQCGRAWYTPCQAEKDVNGDTFYYTCNNGKLSNQQTLPESCTSVGQVSSDVSHGNSATTLCGHAYYTPCQPQINVHGQTFYYTCTKNKLSNQFELPYGCGGNASPTTCGTGLILCGADACYPECKQLTRDDGLKFYYICNNGHLTDTIHKPTGC